MKAAVAHSTGTDPAIKEVKEKLKELPLQMDWKKFETEFTAVHPEFARKLHKQFPKLTPTEMKMCSLLRLNLRSQEIARLLNLAERSVETHRFNIRRKLEIERERGLGEFLNTL
jgi:DNA-binding CsgD family transcriptional regulator